MSNKKIEAGSLIPNISLKSLDAKEITLGQAEGGADWQMVVVYRGKHCPKCTEYLTQLRPMKQDFLDIGIEVVVISADPEKKAIEHTQENLELPFRVGYDLSIAEMKTLGLYISDPRSPEETDRPFSEPATFVVNDKKNIHIVDISNAPFSRPDLKALLGGLKYIRNNDYPIRGTHE